MVTHYTQAALPFKTKSRLEAARKRARKQQKKRDIFFIITTQAALPFKTKPKLEAARKPGKRGTLEQRRAVVLEPHERKAATLLQQLNAICNDKATKHREQQ